MHVEVLSICISYYKELSLKYISYILSIWLLPECFLTQSCQSYEAAALYYWSVSQASVELQYVEVATHPQPTIVMPPTSDSNVQYAVLHHNYDKATGMTTLDYRIQLFLVNLIQ